MVAFLLATAAGAGFAATYEFKKLLKNLFGNLSDAQTRQFLDRGYVSVGLLFLGFICMALLSLLSSITPTASSSRRGFFG